MRRIAIATWAILAITAVGCAEETPAAADTAGADTAKDSTGDAAADTAADANVDTVGEVSADTVADTIADTADTSDTSSDSAAETSADTDTATSTDAVTDAAGDVAGDAAVDAGIDAAADTAIEGVLCEMSNPKFPAFAKTCKADGDCFVAIHQVDCCGTKAALGLASTQQAAFTAAEALCEQQFPDCKCMQQPTVAEDGYTAKDSEFKAICQAGLCQAVVPSPVPECTSSGLKWPKPPKACTTKADCTYVLRTIDCCGSQLATGIGKTAKDAYEAQEVKCAQTMAICDCMPKPVALEDGSSAGDGMIAVECSAGKCSTYAKP